MPPLRRQTAAQQIADHLRKEIRKGVWSKLMPGQIRLAGDLEVSRNSVEAALRILERDGILTNQGPGRRRIINPAAGRTASRRLRVAILLYESIHDRQEEYIVELQHALVEAGHTAVYAAKSLTDLNFSILRLSRFVEQSSADAWVICGGSREILEWFSEQPFPSFALFGRQEGLPLAAAKPDKAAAYTSIARTLIELGHKRVSILCKSIRRLPKPGRVERAFLEELKAAGIPTGDFNLPDWEETKEGFQNLLSALFRVTPPTALLIDEAFLFTATLQFLAQRGIKVPDEVSLICTDMDQTFVWCEPSIAHIEWDSRHLVRRIVRWAAKVSHGQEDIRQILTPASLVEGGTIGPAPKP